ncbi:UDP-glucosyltransferase 2-like isoform X2 [Leguminivora glycinivorella]|nr:UDP-glucosyltransferase 2-like isoform X2 [Leguminivora glycinivorella]
MSQYWKIMKTTSKMFFSYEEETIRNQNVQDLLNDHTTHFDVVIAEWFHSDMFAGFATVFNCPLIWSSTTEAHWMVLSLIDEASNPAYTPDMNSAAVPPFSLAQRMMQFTIQAIFKAFKFMYFSSRDKTNYEVLFGPHVAKRGNRELPPFEEVLYNGTLLFSNSHPVYGQSMRLPANCKEIGGFWIEREPKPLPQDLQKIMDSAYHGVIYFSMGSIWKSKDMPDTMKSDILRVFSNLQQTIIWKLEEELPDLPKNVHIVKWAPQHGILAHPNCRLFITHGGIFSVTETVFFGVPVVGIPVGYDQTLNIDRAVHKGFARKVQLAYDLADDLKLAIEEVLSNDSYRIRAKELSQMYHDRPVSPGAELVHWVEHVVRTRGAPHLRSPALMLQF